MLQSCSWLPDQQANGTCCVQGNKLTPVGFEPTPLRNGALSHRLRPLGQSVSGCIILERNRKISCSHHVHHTGILRVVRAQLCNCVTDKGFQSSRAHLCCPSSNLWLVRVSGCVMMTVEGQIGLVGRRAPWKLRRDACGVRAHALTEWRLEPPP